MKIWITGESSFIAKNLNEWFNKSNKHQIINNLDNKDLDYNRTYNCGYPGYSNEIDIFDFYLSEIMSTYKPDIVIHNAAVVGTDYCTQFKEHAIKTNINGTYKVIEACNRLDIPMLFFSTSVCYEPKAKLKENDFLRSSTIYGATKLACEEIIRTTLNNKYMIIVPAMLFGAHDLHSATNKMLMSGLGIIKDQLQINLDPDNLKPFIYIDNFLDAIELLLDNFNDIEHGRINISPDDNHIFDDIIDHIEYLNIKSNYILKPELDYLGDHTLDNTLIKSLGWKQKIDLFEGIKLTYEKLRESII